MEIQQVKYPVATVADALDPPQIRKGGWHMTTLIYEGLALAKGQRRTPYDAADEHGLMALGRIWEAVARPWLEEYCNLLGYTVQFPTQEEPLETWCEDILGNMDGIIWDGERKVAIVDMKMTTGNPDMTQKPNYMHQFKAYCYSEGVSEFWCLILHIPKRGAPGAHFYHDIYHYSEAEKQATWSLITNAKRILEEMGEIPHE